MVGLLSAESSSAPGQAEGHAIPGPAAGPHPRPGIAWPSAWPGADDDSAERSPTMDLNYSPEELAFRDEVRGWLRTNLPADLRQKMESYQELSNAELLRWHQILAKKGWRA